MQTVWITGARGLIGSALVRTAAAFAAGWNVRGLTRPELDLLDLDTVRRRFNEDRPQRVIHCAAMSHTPTCDQNPALARRLNVEATALLAELARDIPFFFFSSDLVFDGRAGNYDEAAPVHPLSVYGETKAAAEAIVLANPRHTVLRTSLNGGVSPTGDRGFNEQLRLAFANGREVKLFTDEFRCPIPAAVTARAVWELAGRNQPGLYHVAGRERLSRWEIGQLIAARWPQLNPKLAPGSLRDFPGGPRPADCSMNCAKVQQLLTFPLPRLSEWLAAHLDEPF